MFLNCEQFAKNLSELEDDRVTIFRRAEARFHLIICPHCRRYMAQFREVRRRLASMKSSPTFSDERLGQALATFRDWTRESRKNDSEAPPSAGKNQPES